MLDPTTKSPLKSVGFLGGTGAMAVSLLNAFGIQIVPGSKADALVTIALIAVGIYGRIFATQKLGAAGSSLASSAGSADGVSAVLSDRPAAPAPAPASIDPPLPAADPG